MDPKKYKKCNVFHRFLQISVLLFVHMCVCAYVCMQGAPSSSKTLEKSTRDPPKMQIRCFYKGFVDFGFSCSLITEIPPQNPLERILFTAI